MKVTKEIIKTLDISDADKRLLDSLLLDVEELNNELDNCNQDWKKVYIDYQDWHNEYSSERVDPCPDYYGYYFLKFENDESESCCTEMTIHELDIVLCALINLVEYNKKI